MTFYSIRIFFFYKKNRVRNLEVFVNFMSYKLLPVDFTPDTYKALIDYLEET